MIAAPTVRRAPSASRTKGRYNKAQMRLESEQAEQHPGKQRPAVEHEYPAQQKRGAEKGRSVRQRH